MTSEQQSNNTNPDNLNNNRTAAETMTLYEGCNIPENGTGLVSKETRITCASIEHSGPLPTSAEFARYESTCPGAANRILCMAEEQLRHRVEMERMRTESVIQSQREQDKLVDGAISLEKDKLNIGCFIISLFILSAVVLGYCGRTTEAMVSLALPFFGFLGYVGIDQWRKSRPPKDNP